jgi:hypothetical protein
MPDVPCVSTTPGRLPAVPAGPGIRTGALMTGGSRYLVMPPTRVARHPGRLAALRLPIGQIRSFLVHSFYSYTARFVGDSAAALLFLAPMRGGILGIIGAGVQRGEPPGW